MNEEVIGPSNQLYAAIYYLELNANLRLLNSLQTTEVEDTFHADILLEEIRYERDYSFQELQQVWSILIQTANIREEDVTKKEPNLLNTFVNLFRCITLKKFEFSHDFLTTIREIVPGEDATSKKKLAKKVAKHKTMTFNMNIFSDDIKSNRFSWLRLPNYPPPYTLSASTSSGTSRPFSRDVFTEPLRIITSPQRIVPTAPLMENDGLIKEEPEEQMFTSNDPLYETNKRQRDDDEPENDEPPVQQVRRFINYFESPVQQAIIMANPAPDRPTDRVLGDIRGLVIPQPQPTLDRICCLIHSADSSPSSQRNRSTMSYENLSNLLPLSCQSDMGVLFGLSEQLHTFSENIFHFTTPNDCRDINPPRLEGFYATAYKCLSTRLEPNIVFRTNTIILPHNNLFNEDGSWNELLNKFDGAPLLNRERELDITRTYKRTISAVNYELNPYFSYHIEVIARDYIEHLKRRSLRIVPSVNILYRFNRNEIDACPSNVITLLAQIIFMLKMTFATNVNALTIPDNPWTLDIAPELQITFNQGKKMYDALNQNQLPATATINAEFLNYFIHNCYPSEITIPDAQNPPENQRILTRPPNVSYVEKVGIVAIRNICRGDPLVFNRVEQHQTILQRSAGGSIRREEIAREPPSSRRYGPVDEKSQDHQHPFVETLSDQEILTASAKKCGIILF